jgi:hypothetical protein
LARKESFYNLKFARTPKFYSNSGSTGQTGVAVPDRLQDDRPVRPSRDTGLTGGVSLIGFVPILGVNTHIVFPILVLAHMNSGREGLRNDYQPRVHLLGGEVWQSHFLGECPQAA